MAITTRNPLVVTRKHVVRLRPATAPGPALPAPAVPPFHLSVQPRTAFWRARKQELELADKSLEQLRRINDSVGDVSTKVGEVSSEVSGLQFPSNIAVTTTMSSADQALIDRLTRAVEKVADTLPGKRGGDCAELTTLSPRAFSLIARLTTLTAHLMDRDDVSACSTVRKLEEDRPLIDAARGLLVQAGLDVKPFDDAFALEPFKSLASNPETDISPAVFDELEERAALLLAIKCLVATSELEGDDPDDWPPRPDETPPPDDPIGVAVRAPQKQRSRAGRG